MSIARIGPAGIPAIGLGTFRTHGAETRDIVEAALAEGYRHIDTARMYENEADVGRGIRASGVPRDQIFLTTKIEPQDFRAEDFHAAAEASLRALETDYVDLLLLHWPSREVPLSETLTVLETLISQGKVRYGGVSNFTIALTREARELLTRPLAANQIEYHPFIDQTRLGGFLAAETIPFEAYCPLARGGVVGDPVLKEIAAAHDANEGQVALAWILSKPQGVALPKTANRARLAPNLAAAEIALSEEEIARIDGLARPNGRLVSPSGTAPDWDD